MMAHDSPQDRLHALLQTPGRPVQEATIAAIFDQLPPVVEPQSLLGEWQGGSFDTGHPSHELLVQSGWAGKTFRSEDDVDPVVVLRRDDGQRVAMKQVGGARIRQVKFRGVVSAAMIYDKMPIIDSFRYVSDNMVLGAMDSKLDGQNGTYYFYLKKLRSKL